jgi:hypothetical protein
VIVTAVEVVTAVVPAVKVAVVAPAGTVIVAGTEAAAVLLLVSATAAPPVGAAPVSVTVPTELPPPVTLDGFIARVEMAGGFTVKLALALDPP